MTPCFAAFCQCGNVIGLAVDEPKYAKENAKSVGKWMRDGFRIEKIICDDVHSGKVKLCKCQRNKPSQAEFPMEKVTP
jgi:hypothetical protein